MSCKAVQSQITNAIAASEPVSRVIESHLQSCAICREFHSTEVLLFASIDSGVRRMVNAAPPASLLSRARIRVAEGPLSRPWILSWRFAFTAIVLILAISMGLFRGRREPHNSKTFEISASVGRAAIPQRAAETSQSRLERTNPRKGGGPPASRSHPLSDIPQIMIRPEERAAFAAFVRNLPEDNQTAVALTHAAPEKPDSAVEIELMRIEVVEVTPLEPASQERP